MTAQSKKQEEIIETESLLLAIGRKPSFGDQDLAALGVEFSEKGIKVNDKMGIYFDVAYNMVSSGFVGVEKDTGTGSNSNGFFDISLGVTFNFSKTKTFQKVGESY